MAKNRKGSSKSNASKSSSSKQQPANATLVPPLNSQASANSQTNLSRHTPAPSGRTRPLTWREIFFLDRKGYHVLVIVISLGTLFGFMAGAGVIFPYSAEPSSDHPLGKYEASLMGFISAVVNGHRSFLLTSEGIMVDTPDNPRYFAVLREAVVREKGGYVHPDLGMMYPAPSGAVRGLGMLRDNFGRCQRSCYPGTDHDRALQKRDLAAGNHTWLEDGEKFDQEDVLIRVPLKFQMTRAVAIDTLSSKFSTDTRAKFLELDDAAMLVLLLAHEKNVGRYSRWLPFIASLPPQPSCGYFRSNRQSMLNAIAVYREQLGVDTEGWESELLKATEYSESIVDALTNDFGSVLAKPPKDPSQKAKNGKKPSASARNNVTIKDTIAWALCHVASRATAGNEKHGSLRLVPIVDMINHHLSAGGFLELTGKERIDNGDPVNAKEDDSGTFIVRSLRHGRRKPLKIGHELLVNYNVPQYSALDWLVSLGFVPEERWDPWIKLDPALPPLRRDGPGASSSQGSATTEQLLQERDEKILAKLQALDL